MIVTLLTDFGLTDHYVAAIKGVILTRNPRITLVDISHEVAPQDVGAARYLLNSCYREFPIDTVHLAVVDPGVGSQRRPLSLRCDGRHFVGPDNGLFAEIWSDAEERSAHVIDASAFGRGVPSRTFHGRDIFAPAAAALASGFPIERIGPRVDDISIPAITRSARRAGRDLAGQVVYIDRFGNCITNLRPSDFGPIDWRGYHFVVGGVEIQEVRDYYAESASSEAFVLLGSGGYLEIALNGGSAAKTLGISVGAGVQARPSAR